MQGDRSKIIQELIAHLEKLDADALSEQMPKPEVKVEIETEGAPPMEGEMAPEMMAEAPMEEEISDEEFEELMRG